MAGRGAGATYAVASADLSSKAGPPVLLSPDGTRLDGRAAKECRTPFMQVGAVSGAAGSGYVELGQTKVIVSVFGPRESKKAEAFSDQGRLNCAVEFTSFATSKRGKASQDKELSSLLHKALEGAVQVHTFPKTTVDVFALILQSGGGELPALISCASLALADAGIGMIDLVTAVSASCVGQQQLLDSTAQEERWEDGGMTLAYMPSRNEVTYFHLTGEWSGQRASQSIELCLDACRKLAGVLTVCLKESE